MKKIISGNLGTRLRLLAIAAAIAPMAVMAPPSRAQPPADRMNAAIVEFPRGASLYSLLFSSPLPDCNSEYGEDDWDIEFNSEYGEDDWDIEFSKIWSSTTCPAIVDVRFLGSRISAVEITWFTDDSVKISLEIAADHRTLAAAYAKQLNSTYDCNDEMCSVVETNLLERHIFNRGSLHSAIYFNTLIRN